MIVIYFTLHVDTIYVYDSCLIIRITLINYGGNTGNIASSICLYFSFPFFLNTKYVTNVEMHINIQSRLLNYNALSIYNNIFNNKLKILLKCIQFV